MKDKTSELDSIEAGIIAALCYASVFKFPLTSSELVAFAPYKIHKITIFKEALQLLVERKIVDQKDDFYFLSGESSTVSRRVDNTKHTKEKILVAEKWIWLFQLVHSIQAVYLTGSVAAGNATDDDDIDLMFVTNPNRVWLSRLGISIALSVLGLKRSRDVNQGKSVKDKFCINLFLDTNAVALPVERHDLYTAHEIVQAKLVWYRKGYDPEMLLKKNGWVYRFLPNTVSVSNNLENLTGQATKIGDLLEKGAYRLQTWYMKAHRTTEDINQTSAFFHPRKTAQHVLKAYKEKLKVHMV